MRGEVEGGSVDDRHHSGGDGHSKAEGLALPLPHSCLVSHRFLDPPSFHHSSHPSQHPSTPHTLLLPSLPALCCFYPQPQPPCPAPRPPRLTQPSRTRSSAWWRTTPAPTRSAVCSTSPNTALPPSHSPPTPALSPSSSPPPPLPPALLSEAVTSATAQHPSLSSPPLPPPHLLPTLDHAHQSHLRSLDAAVASAKRDGERSLIFQALAAYADALYRYGDFPAALTKHLEAREWAGPSSEVLSVCLGIIHCSILTGSLSHVKSQVQRVRATQSDGTAVREDTLSPALNAQLDAALGLSALKTAAYRAAATSFLAVTSVLRLTDVISLRDCMVYGTVCALATFSRSELKTGLLGVSEWKKNVEAVCPAWKAIVVAYVDSDYATTFRLLGELTPALALHPALSPHLHRLLKDVRAKAAVQFFLPYTALQLSVMAEGMGVSVAELEPLIAELIGEGKLHGRLDMQRGLLVKKGAESRRRMYEKTRKVSDRVVRDSKASMMRMSLIECDIAVMAPKKGDKDGKGGGN